MPELKYIIFDLDETLYPTSNGLMEAMRERIVEYMQEKLGLSYDEADERRVRYLKEYGLTVGGLRAEEQVDVRDYMSYVHDLPHDAYIRPNPSLDAMLTRLPQTKVIFTNSDLDHVRRTLDALGVPESRFGLVFDYETAGCCAKPDPEAYRRLLKAIGANGDECLIVEDSLRNLAPAKQVCHMKTVLVDRDKSRRMSAQPDALKSAVDWVVDDITDIEAIVSDCARGACMA